MTKLFYKCTEDKRTREIEGLTMTEEKGKFWIYSDKLKHNLVYHSDTYENALLSSIASLLHTIELRDERIESLQRIADLAEAFADQIKPDCDQNY